MPIPPKARTMRLNTHDELGEVLAKLKALASEPRLRILNLLGDRAYNLSEMARILKIHIATIALHVSILEEAGLIVTEQRPGVRGTQKICARLYGEVALRLPREDHAGKAATELTMPIGAFTDFEVFPVCGMLGQKGIIGVLDDPVSFYEPGRHAAGLLWFHHGYVEYRFPNRLTPKQTVESLHLEVELCSEAPLHHSDWPSDITLWINEVEVGTWTSPADFGGQRGRLTPAWWGSHSTQYGLLKTWQVNHEGSFIDGSRLSQTCLDQLELNRPYISVKIGVKREAEHCGGVNLFGRTFGNYPHDLVLRLQHT
jgi:predicted transcriptional regulator